MSSVKLGFIGTGVMGTGIIKNFLKNGQEVVVFNRTKAHAQPVIEAGATWLNRRTLSLRSATLFSQWSDFHKTSKPFILVAMAF